MLLAKLDQTEENLAASRTQPALAQLSSLYHELCGFKNGGQISEEDYQLLYTDYASVVKSLGKIPKESCQNPKGSK